MYTKKYTPDDIKDGKTLVGRSWKKCKKCNANFFSNSGVQKWCIQCTTFKCKNCGDEYRYAGTTLNKFCSKKCFDDFRRGKKWIGKKTPISAEKRKKINDALRAKYQSEDGAAYKLKISQATKLAMQRPEVQEKIRAPRSALSLEHRMQLSDLNAGKMPANNLIPGKFGNIQRGYYDINGTTIYFRSKWEANYALYLDWLTDHKQIYKWEFEPDTFMFEQIKLGTRSYTPDFKVYNTPEEFEYHEVKGYMDSKSKTKLKRFKKYFPQHKLVLIDSPVYLLLKKQIGKVCGFYE